MKLGDPSIPFRSFGQTPCPCRICTILEDNAPGAPTRLGKQGVTRGKTPGGLGSRPATTGDYGVFCDACSQSGTIDGRCSRYSIVGLGSMPQGPPVQPHVVLGATRSVVSGVSDTPSMESLVVTRQTSRDLPCQVSLFNHCPFIRPNWAIPKIKKLLRVAVTIVNSKS